ncbi:MAG TPA: hypothetical protein VEW67_01255 [Thermoleophilaceae bacterium]|nr:hypothetical protein [Thermoleophilaceae bacterium]
MPSRANSGGNDAAARALRAFGRGATTLRGQVARSIADWHRRQAAGGPAPSTTQPPATSPHTVAASPTPVTADPGISEIEVSDLRAELARELERLAGADITASRGSGKLAGDTPAPDGQS